MGRLRFGQWAWAVVTISLFLFLPGCAKSKPAPPSPFPAKITLNPSPSFSLQVGTIFQLSATAQNGSNANITPVFTYTATPLTPGASGILDIAPGGFACAGSWNAPLYTICTPAGTGVVQVTASALGATSPPTLFFVHPPIDNIQISVVPPVNSPPPACPNQAPLPVACNLPFNTNAANYCLSQNQVEILQATAYNKGVDITDSVGPFTWSEVGTSVAKITPFVTVTAYNVPTNQANASPATPGQTQIIASASGVSSQPFNFEACPVQCIDLELSVNGVQGNGQRSYVVSKGTSETIAATAVDVQGCIVPKAPLTWISSEPAALSAGGTACPAGTTCSVASPAAGSATISASCTPPTCNVGFPLNPAAYPAPFIPQPVYPVTAISGLATGAATSTNVLATSQDCYSDDLCFVGIYNVSTSTNLPGGATQIPVPPNSLIFSVSGGLAYMGSEFGALSINAASIGTSTGQPFTFLAAPGTPLGVVTGKVLAVSLTGGQAIFSDTVSTPNQVYVANTVASTPLNINSATAAAFSPDGLKAFILANGGNTLYVYSALQYLQPPIALGTPATSIVFNSTGSFALLSGGGFPGNLAAYNTCDNSAVNPALSSGLLPGPPLFLKMVPAGTIPLNSTFGGILIPNLEPTGLDFFIGLDNTGIDIIATNSSQDGTFATLCPQKVTLAQTPGNTTFAPVHINIGQGTFHPINFFLSPDSTRAYIVASDRSSVLVYDFTTNSVSASIPIVNGATPVAADMTVDGAFIYVAGSDGLLHQLNTALAIDEIETTFTPLPNSPNNFCFTGNNCALNIVAVKP